MKTLRAMLVRFCGLFRRRRHEAEMNDELCAHLNGLIERNVAAGMPAEEARHAALRAFGGVEQIKERARDERVLVWLDQLRQDFSHALRALSRHRGFAIVAALTLALGLGVNTALFTVFNAVALRPLPLKDPEQLVDVHARNEIGWRTAWFSHADYLDLRAAQQAFDGLAAWAEQTTALDSPDRRAPSFFQRSPTGGATSNLPVQLVSENYFAVLGTEIVLGRGFLPSENAQPGAHPVIVLQHQFWVEQFNADPAIVGQTLRLRDTSYSVIGVAASEFVGKMPAPPMGWIPAMMLEAKNGNGAKALADRANGRFHLVGRLRPGVSPETARAELELILDRLSREHPRKDAMTRVELATGTTFISMALNWRSVAAFSPVWLSFLSVLVIACANVANLLLARASTRQQEIGVRIALGATRGRIIRHLLAESTLIGMAGGAAGLLVTTWMLHIVRTQVLALIPPSGQARNWQFLDLSPDYRVFGFTLALAFIAAIGAGLFPAWLASRANVNGALKSDGAAFSRRSRVRHGLVVAQVALSLTLLAASALLARQVLRIAWLDTGLKTDGVFTGNVSLLPADFAARDSAGQAQAIGESTSTAVRLQALEAARTLPGIQAIALVNRAPFVGRMRLTPVQPDGAAEDAATPFAKFNLVSADYFGVVGLVVQRGRAFNAHEVFTSARVAVISAATARRFWPGQDPIGRRLRVASVALTGGWIDPRQAQRDETGAFLPYEVVGVVPDARSGWVWEEDETMLYLPMPLKGGLARGALIRLNAPREAVLPLARGAAEARGGGLGISIYRTLDEDRNMSLLPYKGAALVSATLGGLALLLSVVGLYGVMAFAVNHRVREIGIRVALGATGQRIVRLFVGQGMRLVATGLAVGSLGALAVPVILSKIIVGARPFDPLPLAVVVVLLAAAALLACWLPARRATKVDPMTALRAE